MYADNVFPLSENALKDRSSYFVQDEEGVERYGLDFDRYWSFAEGGYPTLTGQNATIAPPTLEIALSSSASRNPHAQAALEQLPKLRGLDAHSSVILSQVDMTVLKKLGIHVTCEPKYQTKKLYHAN